MNILTSNLCPNSNEDKNVVFLLALWGGIFLQRIDPVTFLQHFGFFAIEDVNYHGRGWKAQLSFD